MVRDKKGDMLLVPLRTEIREGRINECLSPPAEMFSRTINQTLVQLLSPDELRGRILGVYMLNQWIKPLGGFLMGAGASLLGAPLTSALGAGIWMFFALSLLFRSSRIREL